MAARTDHSAVPGLRVCKGRQMCPLHSDTPAHQPSVICHLLSLCLCPSSIWIWELPLQKNSPLSHFLFITLIHSVSYQEYKHAESLAHIHKFSVSAFSPSHAVQTNQQSEPEAFCPSGQPFPAGPSVQKERESSNPHPA